MRRTRRRPRRSRRKAACPQAGRVARPSITRPLAQMDLPAGSKDSRAGAWARHQYTGVFFLPTTARCSGSSWHHWDVSILMRRVIQLPAPGRGAYDRALSRAERDADHCERLLVAGAEVLSSGAATVTRIVAHAGVGRSTFYEFFDSPDHLLEHLRQRALRRLETVLTRALAEAHTPPGRVRALVRAWLKELAARPAEARVVLTRSGSDAPLSPAGALFKQALARCSLATRDGGAPATTSTADLTLLAAAGAVEVVTRRHVSSAPLKDDPRVLSELIIRLLG